MVAQTLAEIAENAKGIATREHDILKKDLDEQLMRVEKLADAS